MRSLRREDGFTLPELLTAVTMATITMLAAFGLLETAIKRTGETQARVEATQRGRQALDVMTRQLRSQVCLPADQLPVGTLTAQPAVAEAKPNSVTVFVDLSSGTASFTSRVEKRVLTFDPAKRTIVEQRYKTTGSVPVVFKSTPEATKTLLSNVVPDPTNTNSVGEISVFRYWAFGAGTPTVSPKTDVELANAVAPDLGRIARIDLAYVTRASEKSGSTITPGSLTLRDQVYIRAADPNDPAPYPTCV